MALRLLSSLLVTFGMIDMKYLHLWTVLTGCTEYACTEIQASGIVCHFAAAL
jgi:hypothetical protein